MFTQNLKCAETEKACNEEEVGQVRDTIPRTTLHIQFELSNQLKEALNILDFEQLEKILDYDGVGHVISNITIGDCGSSHLHSIVKRLHADPRKTHLTKILGKIMQLNDIKYKGDNDGKTPFHLACYHCSEQVVEILLQKCHDINHTCCALKTPLHYAAEKGNVGNVMKLLQHGGNNFKLKDREGKTALEIANDKKYTRVVVAITEEICKSEGVLIMFYKG